MAKVSDLLTDKERAAIRAPIEHARTFPRRAFFDDAFFQLEKDHAFNNTWIAVGFGTSIPNAGDILPINVLGLPIILVRDDAGMARAFHNVCPYDGCEVSIRKQEGVAVIETPYHGWHYDLTGKLIKAGFWDGTADAHAVDLASLQADLIPIDTHEWLQTLFIFLGDECIAFEQQHHNMITHFSEIDFSRLKIGSGDEGKTMVQELSVKANWKTSYENYSPNVYHESFVHAMYRKSPHSPRVTEAAEKTYTEINYPCGFLGLCYDNSIGGSFYGESALPPIKNKDGSDNKINTIANLYPNWVITMLGDAARIAIFMPEGPENGTQYVSTLFDESAANEPTLLSDRKKSERSGITARIEDNRICESIQRARHSPAVTSQFYSPFWDAMHYTMNNLILQRLEKSEQ